MSPLHRIKPSAAGVQHAPAAALTRRRLPALIGAALLSLGAGAACAADQAAGAPDAAPAAGPAVTAAQQAPAPAVTCAALVAPLAANWGGNEITSYCSDSGQAGHCTAKQFQELTSAPDAVKDGVEAYCKQLPGKDAAAAKPAAQNAAAPANATPTLTSFTLANAIKLYPQVDLQAYPATADSSDPCPERLPANYPVDVVSAASDKKAAGAEDTVYAEVVTGCRWWSYLAHPGRCSRPDDALKAQDTKALLKKQAAVETGGSKPTPPATQTCSKNLAAEQVVDDRRHYLIPASQLANPANVDGVYLTTGLLYFPFKYRRYDHNFDTTSQNINGTLGVANKGDIFDIDWVAFLGLTNIDVNANPAATAKTSTTPTGTSGSKGANGLSMGFGVIVQRVADSNWNFGIFAGWDHLTGGDGSTWRYDRKVWYSVGLGYNWNTGKQAVSAPAGP